MNRPHLAFHRDNLCWSMLLTTKWSAESKLSLIMLQYRRSRRNSYWPGAANFERNDKLTMKMFKGLLKPILMVMTLMVALTGSCFSQVCNILVEAATQSGNGIAEIPPNGATAFAIATTNIGQSCSVVVFAASSVQTLTTTICQTNPQNAQCINPPAPAFTLQFPANAQPTFSIFLQANGPIPPGAQVNVVFLGQNCAVFAPPYCFYTAGSINVPVQTVN
jgi:hypothetical protein